MKSESTETTPCGPGAGFTGIPWPATRSPRNLGQTRPPLPPIPPRSPEPFLRTSHLLPRFARPDREASAAIASGAPPSRPQITASALRRQMMELDRPNREGDENEIDFFLRFLADRVRSFLLISFIMFSYYSLIVSPFISLN